MGSVLLRACLGLTVLLDGAHSKLPSPHVGVRHIDGLACAAGAAQPPRPVCFAAHAADGGREQRRRQARRVGRDKKWADARRLASRLRVQRLRRGLPSGDGGRRAVGARRGRGCCIGRLR